MTERMSDVHANRKTHALPVSFKTRFPTSHGRMSTNDKLVAAAAVRSPSTSSSGGGGDVSETLDLFDQITINDGERNSDGTYSEQKKTLRECSLKDNPNLGCYCRFVAALHAIGHAIAKFPCCYRAPKASSNRYRQTDKQQRSSVASIDHN